MTRLSTILIIGILAIALSTTGTVASHDGDSLEHQLSDKETVEQAIEQYNEQIRAYDGTGTDIARQQLGNEVVNVEIAGETTHTYSAQITDDLQVRDFEMSHRQDATVRVETSVETIRAVRDADSPVETAREEFQNESIRITATDNAGIPDQITVRLVDMASDASDSIDGDTRDTAREVWNTSVEAVRGIADRLGL